MHWFKPGAHLDRRPFHPKMVLKAKMERTSSTRMGVQSKMLKAKSIILKGVHNHKIWPSPTFRMSKFSKTVQGVSLGVASWTAMSWSGSIWPQRQPRILSSYPTFTFTVAVQADEQQIKHSIQELCYWYGDKKAYVRIMACWMEPGRLETSKEHLPRAVGERTKLENQLTFPSRAPYWP